MDLKLFRGNADDFAIFPDYEFLILGPPLFNQVSYRMFESSIGFLRNKLMNGPPPAGEYVYTSGRWAKCKLARAFFRVGLSADANHPRREGTGHRADGRDVHVKGSAVRCLGNVYRAKGSPFSWCERRRTSREMRAICETTRGNW